MTLGSRFNVPAWLVGLASLPLIFVLFDEDMARTLAAVPVIALAILVFVRLREASYSLTASLIMSVALFAQPNLLEALVRPDGPVWLSAMIFALTASAASLLEQFTVRSVIVLGIALTAIRLVDPIGLMIVGAAVPLLATVLQRKAGGLQAVTLGVLVLFVPVVTGMLLYELHAAYPAATAPVPTLLRALGAVTQSVPTSNASPFGLIATVGFFIPVLLTPVLSRTLRSPANSFVSLLGLAIVAAFAAAAYLGTQRQPFWLASALLPVAAVALASLHAAPSRERIAVPAALLALGFSWAAWCL